MIKSKMYSKIGFITGFILVMFTYWLSGGEFERGKDFASAFVLSFVFGILFFAFGAVFEYKDKQ